MTPVAGERRLGRGDPANSNPSFRAGRGDSTGATRGPRRDGGERALQRTVKYLLDRVGALVGLILTAPLMAVIAALVKLEDGGSVFFRQARLGEGGVPFRMWKFRTMVPDADALLVDGRVPDGTVRVTRIGRFLRGTSLDELPQLINILRGEMSFVGPRPTLPEHLERYTVDQKRRFDARPGVTGLAQIHGRNRVPWSERLRYDAEYVDGFSLWLDARILLRTVKVVMKGEGVVLDRNPESVDDLGDPATPRHEG